MLFGARPPAQARADRSSALCKAANVSDGDTTGRVGSGPKQSGMALLLTACIAPGSSARRQIVRSEPTLRMNDYALALRSYLRMKCDAIETIVFADNSSFPLGSLRATIEEHNVYRRNVELVSFDDRVLPEGVHYGYAELGIIDHALDNSALRQYKTFAKATGRLSFPDLPRLINRLPDDVLVAVDARSQPFFVFRERRPFISTQLMIFDRDFYGRVLKGRRKDMGPSPGVSHIETLLFNALIPLRGTEGVYLRFPVNAEPVGIDAHWGKNYQGLGPRARSLIRAAGRRIVPEIWI